MRDLSQTEWPKLAMLMWGFKRWIVISFNQCRQSKLCGGTSRKPAGVNARDIFPPDDAQNSVQMFPTRYKPINHLPSGRG